MAISAVSKTYSWQKVKYSPQKRQLDILGLATKFVLDLGWDRFWGQNSPQQRYRRSQWLVQKLLDLGPTFIKLGQALSTRVDLIPPEYIQALGQLQDQVPEFSSTEAIAVVERELGHSIDQLYRKFDPTPLAAASLGQVHKAQLPTGEQVVVKVQRPGLERLINLDFEVLHRLIRWANRYLPWTRQYDLEAIYHEFFELLYQEIDYVHEGRNADRFRVNFQDFPRVKVPKIYWRYTTSKVLTLEYAPGIKIDDRQTLQNQGFNLKEIIKTGICAYLKQLLQDGFFQTDPHPGNMAVSDQGNLIFYDFGTMAEVKSMAKDQMVTTFFAVLKKDTNTVVDTLVYMGLVQPMPDMTPVKRLIAFLLEKFRDKPVDFQELEQIRGELYQMFEQQPFRLPAQMTFVLKSLTTLDGVARTLDPQYNLLASAQPFVKSLTLSRDTQGGMMGTLVRQTKELVSYQWNKPSKTEVYLRQLEERLEQGELQLRTRSVESERILRRIYLGIKSLVYACLTGFTLISGLFLLNTYPNWAIAALTVSGLCGLLLLRSLLALSVREKLDRLSEQ